MRICYVPKKFREETEELIRDANEIIQSYAAQGFTLTLRQLYYQFVARALIPNTERSYKRLGTIVNDARLAGLIDWTAIEDRTRWLRTQPSWHSPAEIIESCAAQFHINRWENQEYRPEVWIEKDALVGVIEGVCRELDVPYFACRGYVSQSEQWRAGQRFDHYLNHEQIPIVFHLGDHDPSGMDMTRDNRVRLRLFADAPTQLEVRRLALNMDQIELYDPPPNPAKLTDARAANYIAEHGRYSWELDALEPRVLANLIRENIEALIDETAWQITQERERQGRERLTNVVNELRRA